MAADAERDDLLAAAQALLAAREDGMVTQAEWDALERAVGAQQAREAEGQ